MWITPSTPNNITMISLHFIPAMQLSTCRRVCTFTNTNGVMELNSSILFNFWIRKGNKSNDVLWQHILTEQNGKMHNRERTGGIQVEKSSKDTASSRNVVLTIGAQASYHK